MNYYEQGSHNVQCDTCKRIIKRTDAKKDWRGHIVCFRCYDPKHPNDYPRQIRPDGEPVVDARPKNTTYLDVPGSLRWDSSSLTWNDQEARWDDDPSNGSFFPWG